MRVLGIDPGSRVTGYGVIFSSENHIRHIASGKIGMPKGNLPSRLHQIYQGIQEVIVEHQPQIAVVEKVFISVNPNSALLLGHARGSAICAAAAHKLEIFEYSTREIKKTVTGNGGATKEQVQFMVQMLMCLSELPGQDEADALATAIAHCQLMPQTQMARRANYSTKDSQPTSTIF